jgi:hypothetical protein
VHTARLLEHPNKIQVYKPDEDLGQMSAHANFLLMIGKEDSEVFATVGVKEGRSLPLSVGSRQHIHNASSTSGICVAGNKKLDSMKSVRKDMVDINRAPTCVSQLAHAL